MIKAIIFDLGSVLIGGNWRAVYRIIAKKLKISRKKLLETIMPLLEKWNKGKIDERKFWQEVEKRIGKRLPREFKKDLWYRTYIEKRPDIKESWKILPELKKRKFRLALLSNTIPPHVKANKKIGRSSPSQKFIKLSSSD